MEGMVFSATTLVPIPQPDKPPDKEPKISFRDKVLGNKQAPPVRERSDLIE